MSARRLPPMHWLLAAALCLLCQLLSSSPGNAQSKRQRAQEHVRQAQAYFKVEAFDKAAVEFEAAFALNAKVSTLFNIALCYEKSGSLVKAANFYEKFLLEAPSDPKAVEARARKEALDRRIAEQEQAEAKIKFAEEKREQGRKAALASDWDKAIELFQSSYENENNPEVIFDLAEAYRGKGEEVLAKAEYQRYIELAPTGKRRLEASRHIQTLSETKSNSSPIAVAPKSGNDSTSKNNSDSGPSYLPAILAFSTSAVALSVGAYMGNRASNLDSDLDTQLNQGNPPLDSGDSRIADGKKDALIANISFAVSGVAAAAGGYLLYRALQGNSEKPATAVLIPTASREHAGLAMEMSF